MVHGACEGAREMMALIERFFVWFYGICVYLRDFDNPRVTPYRKEELPTERDLKWLGERTKIQLAKSEDAK